MAGLSHRQTEILNLARASGRVMVEDLARRFEVSAQTIRKDLNDLCEQRALTRIHVHVYANSILVEGKA